MKPLGICITGFSTIKNITSLLRGLFPVGQFLTQQNYPKLENVDLGIEESSSNKELTLTLRNWKNPPLHLYLKMSNQ
jgi:hypothetical protein